MQSKILLSLCLFFSTGFICESSNLYGDVASNGLVNYKKLLVSFDAACSSLDSKISQLQQTFPCVKQRGSKRSLISTELVFMDVSDSSCLTAADIDLDDYCITSVDFEPIFSVDDFACNAYDLESAIAGYPYNLDRLDKTYDLTYVYLDNQGGDSGVDIYILDTGIQANHTEFFSGQVVQLKTNGNITHTHGTHVAGTAGGFYYGVSFNLKIYDYNVCSNSDTTCSFEDIFNGLDAAMARINSTGRRGVINLSLGGRASAGSKALYDQKFQQIIAVGGVVTCAAGNDNVDACTYSPASSDYCVTVGSHNANGHKSSFSNYGGCVDVWAPGNDITSSIFSNYSFNNLYGNLSGTSMATPHVTGVISSLLTTNKTLTYTEVINKLKNNSFMVTPCISSTSCRGVYYTCEVPVTPAPTSVPTRAPVVPTTTTTRSPTRRPTNRPTSSPTHAPTRRRPTNSPTPSPTRRRPTNSPTPSPTRRRPTNSPTRPPTRRRRPTMSPTNAPVRRTTSTMEPTNAPVRRTSTTTSSPTAAPTRRISTSSPSISVPTLTKSPTKRTTRRPTVHPIIG